MSALVQASWRFYPAMLLALVGLWVATRGVRTELGAHRLSPRNPAKALTFVRGLRLSILGLAIVALAAAWIWQILWIGILAAIIGAEETLETTIVIVGLTSGKDLRLGQ